jgi:hypothetical protein
MTLCVRKTIVSLTGLVLLVAFGCDSGPSISNTDASMEEATVKGTVTAGGAPLTSGQVSFDASNASRKIGADRGPIGKDGTYTVKTKVGKNRITVESPQLKGDDVYNENTLEVKSGENSFDIAIQKK